MTPDEIDALLWLSRRLKWEARHEHLTDVHYALESAPRRARIRTERDLVSAN